MPTIPSNPESSPMAKALSSKQHYYAFLVTFLVLSGALGSFVNDMYSPALPAMCRFFHCSIPTVQMGLTAGMAGLALGQLILGPMSDRYGRKPVLIASVALFIVAAVVSVFSPNIGFFTGCRFFQGLGASGGYFLARTIPADIYMGRPLAKLMALTGAINGVAPAAAPVVGGITADAFGWKGIFVVLACFAGIILLCSIYVKESLSDSRRTQGPWWRATSGYKQLLQNRPFVIHVCFKGTALGMLFAYISSSPFVLQTHYGLSQTEYGLLVGLGAVFVAAGSMISLRFKPLKKAAFVGSLIMAAGVVGLAFALLTIHNMWIYVICNIVMLSGLGLIFTTSNTLAMNEGREHAGEASALLGVAGYIVGAAVSPLVGMGDVMRSSAIVFLVLGAIVEAFAFASKAIAPDLDK